MPDTLMKVGIPTVLSVFAYLGWQIRGKQDKGTCDASHDHLNHDMDKGDEKFKEINDTLRTHIDVLGRMDERLKFIATKNGYKGD